MTEKPQRWQVIAWRIAAHDLMVDIPEPDQEGAYDWFQWAEATHGGTARLALTIAEAIKETEE